MEQAAQKKDNGETWPATEIFYKNAASRQPLVLNIGGARSSKSYSITQLLAVRFLTEKKKRFLTARKTFPALRMSTYEMAITMLQDRKLYQFLEHNKSEHTLRNPYTGSLWLFTSIDDPEKIKSQEFNYAHMEEANEFNYEDFRILKLRMSAAKTAGDINQIFLSCNPSDFTGWVRTKLMPMEKYDLIPSTYRDNPFLDADYVKELEALENQDMAYWKIYGLGEWAEFKELIYGAPAVVPTLPKAEDYCYGLDFGFNNPTVLLEIGIKERQAMIREIIYQTRLTTPELIDLMKLRMTPYERRRPIYADPEDPGRIQELNGAGFNVYAGDNAVLPGIEFCKRFKVQTTNESPNFIKEESAYKWRKDKNENILDEPVKLWDHSPDAKRYGLYTHLGANEGGAFIGVTKEDIY
jgi:phage terminase large subunit